MASSSSTSLIPKTFKYDMFLSFRGEDTRKNFVDHLYDALECQGIDTFKDDEKIKQGKMIGDQLISSIEDSKYFIIVFSENYASSSWCLDELVKIMECLKTMEQKAYPVFYDVEPSEVRKQQGLFGEAFSKHKYNEESSRKWRKALEEASNLAGWELKSFANGHEAKLIKKIVEEISLELCSNNLGDDENLVGMLSRVKHVISLLETESDEVRMIGIKGIGGGGKTTLARAVFDKMRHQFDGYSFVENVREVSKNSLLGLKSLQKQVLSDVLKDKGIVINSLSEGKSLMKSRLRGRRVVVVLDDVDHIDQLEALAGAPNWFKPGSIIIITTRDEQVLVTHRVKWICDITLLSNDEASCLFNRYAFRREIPVYGYEELSTQVIHYAVGLPLTIKVLGSFLCGKDKLEWEDALERLKTIPLQETLEKLELSYIGLDKDYKEIFLDVACLLKGWQKDRAIMLLESCGFNARIGLRVLEQKSLISIDDSGVLGMHDHIEELGMNIVRREHPDEPGKHTRLWIQHEIIDVLAKNLGTEAIRCIKMECDSEIVMEGLGNMKKLRCLIIETDFDVIDLDASEIQPPYFPSKLQYLSLDYNLNESLLNIFGANNLVGLEMRASFINQLWERGERKVLNKLKFIHLSDSCQLRTLDLGPTPNLEKLVVERCYNLVELQMPSLCLNLKSLVVTKSKLRNIDLGPIPNLENLYLEYCYNLVELHMRVESVKLRFLQFTSLKLKTLNIGLIQNLEKLYLKNCYDLVELHMPVESLKLRYLELTGLKLRTLDLGLTPNLEDLNLNNCHDLVKLHIPSSNLTSLELNCFKKLTTLDLGQTPNLDKLHLLYCSSLVELNMPVESLKLRSLQVICSKLKTLDLGLTPNLEKLFLKDCVDLVELHMQVESLKLRSLEVNDSKLRTLDLGRTPNLEYLNLSNCDDLVELHMHVDCPWLEYVDLSYSMLKTFDLGLTPNLKKLVVEECDDLVQIHMPLKGCTTVRSIYFHYTPGEEGHFKGLSIIGSNVEVLKIFDQSECVEELYLCYAQMKHIPYGICMLKHLKSIYLESCTLLENLPEDIDRFECLEKLSLRNCTCLRKIPNSICNMKHLKYFHLPFCIRVEKLPEQFGRLQCLKELNVKCSGITHLPQTIYLLKGLRIVGSKSLLQSCHFATEIQTAETETFGYIG